MLKHVSLVGVFVLLFSVACKQKPSEAERAKSLEKQIRHAQMLFDHGLPDESKKTLFAIYFDASAPDVSRAEALYWLSSVAIHEGRLEPAAEDLKRLATEFKSTARAKGAAAMLAQLRPVLTGFKNDEFVLPAASTYLRNGDFWARDAQTFTIDSSWLPKEEMAAEWYDSVIQNFPRTSAAEEAYSKKIMVLLGWEDRGVYSTTKYGAKREFTKYMKAATDAYVALERAFPESAYLQPIRFQIAQAYWNEREWDQSQEWLKRIIAAKQSDSDFYVQAAHRRLNKLKY